MIDSRDLSPDERRVARDRAYTLLSRLWLHGLTADMMPVVANLPHIGVALPAALSPDDAAAMHHTMLGLTVFPHASYFLDRDGQIGGDESARLDRLYHACAFLPPRDHAPDHVGVILAALAFWTRRELEALRRGSEADVARVRVCQAQCLSAHIVPWIQPFLLAIEAAGMPFYVALAQLTRRVIADHLIGDDVAATGAASASATRAPQPFPSAPNLTAAETTLAVMATYLTIPARSGFFISRLDLQRLSRGLNLPGGFGNRRQTLVNMLRSAAAYDALPALLTELRHLAAVWRARYLDCAQDLPVAANALLSEPWLPRVDQSLELLDRAASMAATAADQWAADSPPDRN